MMGYYGNWGWLGAITGGVFMLLFWAALILVIVWLIRNVFQPSRPSSPTTSHSPLDIAKERYARGEITREQFEQLKRDLS